ncbi:MAG: hypothetical protein JO182_31055 [Acidobacteriaceae bacterium]|nr:hypothetical protein [Acidobacteriaceae bacterium]
MQRLFSTFANGWPGTGILLQRGLAGFLLLHNGMVRVWEKPQAISTIPEGVGAVAGILLLLGLWTPVAGTVAAVMQVWLLLVEIREPLIPIVVATLGATLAMIGPGAWSLDARLFGRKHIEARWPLQK